MSLILFILGLILFVGLVVVHEFGHFLAARQSGVSVEEFGIGFPPRAKVITRKSGTVFSLNWLPLGGFVRLKGEHDADTEAGSFGATLLKNKVKIMLAGIGMNLAVAYILFTILALTGMPQFITTNSTGENQFNVTSDSKIIKDVANKGVVKVGDISKQSPAENVGLKTNDQILSIDSITITSPETLLNTTQSYAGKTVQIKFVDGKETIIRTVTLNQQSPHLGVMPYSAETGVQLRRSTWSAPVVAAGLTTQLTRLTFVGLGRAMKGLASTIAGLLTNNKVARQKGQTKATQQVSGPVGVFFVLREGAKQSLGIVIFIIAVLSLTLAIINVLPIPALDGGRLFVTLLFRALRRPLKKETEDWIHSTGFAFLMILILLITIVDIKIKRNF
ncbi:site-2 protease family protein [Candidatus Saccharibacteria bacterium]|nr:site-2 protease family protein [Candidatus Saccharibacteria bacterium]